RLEFGAFLPARPLVAVGDLQADVEEELGILRDRREVPRRADLVARLVVVLGCILVAEPVDQVRRTLERFTSGFRIEGRDADLREFEVVAAVEKTLLRLRVRKQHTAVTRGNRFGDVLDRAR